MNTRIPQADKQTDRQAECKFVFPVVFFSSTGPRTVSSIISQVRESWFKLFSLEPGRISDVQSKGFRESEKTEICLKTTSLVCSIWPNCLTYGFLICRHVFVLYHRIQSFLKVLLFPDLLVCRPCDYNADSIWKAYRTASTWYSRHRK